MDFVSGVYLSRFFALGWSSNLVVYEFGLKTPGEYALQHDSTLPTPSQPHTFFIHCTLKIEKEGSGNQREQKGATGEITDPKAMSD